MSDADKILLGEDGWDTVEAGAAAVPTKGYRWTALKALTNVSLSAMDVENTDTGLVGKSIPAGHVIPGRWRGITISSGTALMYKTKIN